MAENITTTDQPNPDKINIQELFNSILDGERVVLNPEHNMLSANAFTDKLMQETFEKNLAIYVDYLNNTRFSNLTVLYSEINGDSVTYYLRMSDLEGNILGNMNLVLSNTSTPTIIHMHHSYEDIAYDIKDPYNNEFTRTMITLVNIMNLIGRQSDKPIIIFYSSDAKMNMTGLRTIVKTSLLSETLNGANLPNFYSWITIVENVISQWVARFIRPAVRIQSKNGGIPTVSEEETTTLSIASDLDKMKDFLRSCSETYSRVKNLDGTSTYVQPDYDLNELAEILHKLLQKTMDEFHP